MTPTYEPTNVVYLAPRHSADDRTADAWRIARADLAEAAEWIVRYTTYLDRDAMTPEYRRHVQAGLVRRTRDYLRLLREVFELEQKLDAGKAARLGLTEFERRGYEARLLDEPRQYQPSEIDGNHHTLMKLEFGRGWDLADDEVGRAR